MASLEGLDALIRRLDAQGRRRPDGWANVTKDEICAEWLGMLSGVSDRELHTALTAYAASDGKWWPAVGELIALIPPSGPPLLGWASAWTRALEGMRDGFNRGRNVPPWHRDKPWRLALRDDEHDAAVEALQALVWATCCNSNEKELGFAARTFERTFTARLKAATAHRLWLSAGGRPQLPGPAAPKELADSGATS